MDIIRLLNQRIQERAWHGQNIYFKRWTSQKLYAFSQMASLTLSQLSDQ